MGNVPKPAYKPSYSDHMNMHRMKLAALAGHEKKRAGSSMMATVFSSAPIVDKAAPVKGSATSNSKPNQTARLVADWRKRRSKQQTICFNLRPD